MIETSHHDGIARLTIDMPERSMNVLTQGFADAFEAAIDEVAADERVTGIVITSGKSAFLAGADLGQMADFAAPGVTPAQVMAQAGRYSAVFRKLESCGKPVVGVANGTALGGGLELLLACHYRVAVDDSAAKFGLPEVTLGLLPGAGGTQRLPRMIGIAASIPILTQGKPMNSAKALAAGIVEEVAPADQLLERAEAALREGRVNPVRPWDEKRFKLPGGDAYAKANAGALMMANARVHAETGDNYPAPLAILRCIYEGAGLPIDKGCRIELQHFVRLIRDDVSQNMIRTLFFAKQSADKLHRRPPNAPRSKVRRLGVLGAGFMGAGIAEVSVLAGMDVVLVDRDQSLAERGREAVARTLDSAVSKGRLDQVGRDAALERITAADSADAFADCDLVIEAVVEDADVKAGVTTEAEAAMREDAVFASNTSALPINDLAAASKRAANFIGLHFFSPVAKMALVEVVVGDATSDETLARALDYGRQIRKTPIVVNDGYGFYTTRCVDAYVREGLRMLADGVTPARIENAGRSLGMPVGPLALADEVGIDVLHHIAHFFASREQGAWADDRHRAANAVLDHVFEAGRHGRKTGAGFYVYPASEAKQLDRSFLEAFPAAAEQPEGAGLRQRLLFAQVIEAGRCWAEGVAEDPSDNDLGAVLGWAFPAYLGGPMTVMDNMGLDCFVAECDRLARDHGPRFEVPARLREIARTGARLHQAA